MSPNRPMQLDASRPPLIAKALNEVASLAGQVFLAHSESVRLCGTPSKLLAHQSLTRLR